MSLVLDQPVSQSVHFDHLCLHLMVESDARSRRMSDVCLSAMEDLTSFSLLCMILITFFLLVVHVWTPCPYTTSPGHMQ